jgi:cytidylate kinase
MVVVITGADGAGGGEILPAVAERLAVPAQTRTAPETVPRSGPAALSEEAYKQQSEAEIRRLAATGGVLRDGAAVVLLPDDVVTLRVRLQGPFEERVRQSVAYTGESDDVVRATLEEGDRAWASYYDRHYSADIADPDRYHMVLNSTELDWDLCIEMIEHAARTRGAAKG